MTTDEVKTILGDVLSLADGGASLRPDSALLGALPELDSMAVVNLIGALEAHFGIQVEDDEISADTFASVASLSAFVAHKLA